MERVRAESATGSQEVVKTRWTPQVTRPASRILLAALYLSLAALIPLSTASAADPDKPHSHQGILEPFAGKPPVVTLDDAQLARLARGEAVMISVEDKAGTRGMAIQDIRATPDTIWDRIGAFRDYPQMVDHVEECEPYYEKDGDVRVRFVLSVMTFEYEYYIRHLSRPDLGYMTWTLDYTRDSDLDDSVGYWAVVSHPSDRQASRLFYSVDLKTKGWMPGFIRNMIANKGLETATGWVKRESEALQKQRDDAAS